MAVFWATAQEAAARRIANALLGIDAILYHEELTRRALRFDIQATCPETGARAGLLETPHGIVETPVFMPVGTQATVKGLTQRDLAEDLGVKILLGNTYHLYLRPGHELIRKMGGLHRFMSWPNAILTE